MVSSSNELNKEVGEIIREFRKEAHLTQEQVAEKIGVEVKAIYRWEKGIVRIPTGKLLQLFEVYNKTPDDFIERLQTENAKSYLKMDMIFEKACNDKVIKTENGNGEKTAVKKFNPEGIMLMIILCALTFVVFIADIFVENKLFVCGVSGILIIICAIYSYLLKIQEKINQA